MRKTILILSHSYSTQFIDICNQYARLFNKDCYEVTVAYLTGHPDEEVRQRTLADQILFLNAPKKIVRGLKIAAIRQLLALCKKKKFSIVICHRYKPAYIMLWVSRFFAIPACIAVMHELRTMSSLMRKLTVAMLAQKNWLFAGVSNAVREDLRRDVWGIPQDRVITLYNSIDMECIEPQFLSRDQARATLQLPTEAFVFGNIGRLAPNKDQASLIQAFAKLKPQCPNAKLIIMGDGSLEQTLKQQIQQLGLSEHILLTGFISYAYRYMRAFDVFILSSTQEAFGRVLIEAMTAQTPIIATRTHGIPEAIGNTGTLVNTKSPNELASAMLTSYYWDQIARQQYREQAYTRAQHCFSIPAFRKTFWELPLIQVATE